MTKESCTLIGQVAHLTWPHPNNSGSLKCYPPLMAISMHMQMNNNNNNNNNILTNQIIVTSHWARRTPAKTQPKMVI